MVSYHMDGWQLSDFIGEKIYGNSFRGEAVVGYSSFVGMEPNVRSIRICGWSVIVCNDGAGRIKQ
jgi:hypothetical protein